MRTALSRKRSKVGSPSLTDGDTADVESLLRRRPDSKPNESSSAALAQVLFNKIFLLSRGDNQGRGGFIGLLRDIVGGIMLGTLGMSILLLFDYSNIINLETARVFRKTASDMFNDPAIIESIEEEIEAKLLSMDVYIAMKKELSDSQEVIDQEGKVYEARTKKVASLKAELGPAREEYNKLLKETGLDVFCPDCKWGMGLTCQKRVEYMLENYSDSATTIGCIWKLVDEANRKNSGKCLKPS